MMKFILFCITGFFLLSGGMYFWKQKPPSLESYKEMLAEFTKQQIETLEIQYTAEGIMASHEKELLKGQGYIFLDPQLLFQPYIVMDVKYTQKKGDPKEGKLLWSLMDGEMVLDTKSWEKTHGYEDFLLAKATSNDLKLIQAVIDGGGSIDREQLYGKFKIDSDQVDRWITSCRAKKLLFASGSKLKLHLQTPKLAQEPITLFAHYPVLSPIQNATKMKKKYSSTQIKGLLQKAFGEDFAIRKTEEIFLPIYQITVQNPDDSYSRSYWNALTGKRFEGYK